MGNLPFYVFLPYHRALSDRWASMMAAVQMSSFSTLLAKTFCDADSLFPGQALKQNHAVLEKHWYEASLW